MKINTSALESYLQEVHIEEYPLLLDDDLPDHFNDWLGMLDYSDIVAYAKTLLKANNCTDNLQGDSEELAIEFCKFNRVGLA
jgi:c-di-GMP-related signal transduction protein